MASQAQNLLKHMHTPLEIAMQAIVSVHLAAAHQAALLATRELLAAAQESTDELSRYELLGAATEIARALETHRHLWPSN